MQKRIIVSILLSIVVILLSLGIISYISVNDSINRSLSNMLNLAKIIANQTDALLQSNLTRLYDISLSGAVNLNDNDWEPEKKAIKTAYQYSIFTDGIFILDLKGNIILAYPGGRQRENLLGIPYAQRALNEKKAVISDVYTVPETQKNVIFVFAPLKDRNGDMIGVVGGEINPTEYLLTRAIHAIPAGAHTYIELVDSKGTVIASNEASHLFTCSDHNRFLSGLITDKKTAITACHRCHSQVEDQKGIAGQRTTDMLAFSALSEASWGVAVREPKDVVFAPSMGLKRKFLLLGFISVGSALVLALGMSSSIVRPVKSLIAATRKIAGGNLSEPVSIVSGDEIGLLSEGFETMRIRLSESLDRIQRYNIELEKRVAERTNELQRNRQRLAKLLDEVIEAQEEERKRVARELHDETSQSLAALGMSIDVAAMALKENMLKADAIYELKQKTDGVLDGINQLIRNLRPPVLDDLGLESAMRWLFEKHLSGKGISCYLTATEAFNEAMSNYLRPRLGEKIELILFRVLQEAIINIAKHASASNVYVFLGASDSYIQIGIEDDGVGFDVRSLFRDDKAKEAGFGILGMKERIALLQGRLTICSRSSEGTSIAVSIPLEARDV